MSRSVTPSALRGAGEVPARESLTAVLIAEYEAGATATELAARYGTTKWTVRYRLLRAGVELRGRPTLGPALTVLINEYERGASTLAIARRHGIGRATVQARLAEAGVAMRGHGRSPANPPLLKGPPLTVLVSEYEAGASIATIASKHALGRDTVRVRLLAAGVTMRGRGGFRPSKTPH